MNQILNEVLKNGNARTWTTFVNTISFLKKDCNIQISAQDQTYFDMLASQITGNLSSNLLEFYAKAHNNNSNNLLPKIEQKFQNINEKITKNYPLILSQARDEAEIFLIEQGYYLDTFNLASNSLYSSLNKNAQELGNGLDKTLDNLAKAPEENEFTMPNNFKF